MKEIKLSFKINIALNQSDINWIEEELLRTREEIFKEVFKELLRRIEKEVMKEDKVCEECGSFLVKNGSESKKIRTLIGVIKIKRVRLRCKKCKKDIYPLDEAIGLSKGEGMTFGVRERSLWAAVEVSYEKASEFLKKFTGLEVSRKRIHEMALEEGRRIGDWEEERRRKIFEGGEDLEDIDKKLPEVLYIQVDGTGVNDRASGEWMECKVGASFSKRVLISKGRVWLMDKRSYASIEDAGSFGEKFYLDCIKQGVLNAREIFFIGDGARWIHNLKDSYFPDAIGVLDIWHLEREIKNALGDGKDFLVEVLKGLALRGDGIGIIKFLKGERLRTRDPRRFKKISGVIEYVENNLEWIGNIPKVGGYGSGPIEKTVDITVARRFKKRGMSWYKGGANPLLRLRLLKLNGEWDTYWQERRKKVVRYAA